MNHIQEKVEITKSSYVANDGKKFESEHECIWHEAILEFNENIKKTPTVGLTIDNYRVHLSNIINTVYIYPAHEMMIDFLFNTNFDNNVLNVKDITNYKHYDYAYEQKNSIRLYDYDEKWWHEEKPIRDKALNILHNEQLFFNENFSNDFKLNYYHHYISLIFGYFFLTPLGIEYAYINRYYRSYYFNYPNIIDFLNYIFKYELIKVEDIIPLLKLDKLYQIKQYKYSNSWKAGRFQMKFLEYSDDDWNEMAKSEINNISENRFLNSIIKIEKLNKNLLDSYSIKV